MATFQIVTAARLLAEPSAAKIAAGDTHGRAIPGDAFTHWPVGTVIPPPGDVRSVFRKQRGAVTVTWARAPQPARAGPTVHQAMHDARPDRLTALRHRLHQVKERCDGDHHSRR